MKDQNPYSIDVNDICLIILIVLSIMIFFPSNCRGTTIEEIDRWCHQYQFEDCSLVKAIAKRESSLNPGAYHSEKSGSYGLMQIQCDLAKDKRLENPLKYSCDQLFNAQINVRFGIQYLKLIKRSLIVPSIKNILASYNAGFDSKSKKCTKYSTDKKNKKKCIQFGYHPRKCKNYNKFVYEGFPVMECFPGEYINELYVWKTYRLYRYLKFKEVADVSILRFEGMVQD